MMTIVSQYKMTAKSGSESALRDALIRLAKMIRPIDGCEDVILLQDAHENGLFYFEEHWASREKHKQSSPLLDKAALKAVMAVVIEAPNGRYLERVETRHLRLVG